MSNKRGFRADGLPLRPSALRPRLLYVVVILSLGIFPANFATSVSALSLTLTVPSEALSLDIQPISTFTKSSPSSVSVKTDAFAGYSLSIKAQSSNELVNGSSKLASISENQSEEQYQGEGNLNTWGYKPSKFNGLENTLFLPGPTTSPSLIETTKAANNNNATSYEFTLAAKADATIAHGEYKNTFVFSATANMVSYNIKYELGPGQWEGVTPQTGNTAENTVSLDSHQPTSRQYKFKGWCPQETTSDTCATTPYQPGSLYQLVNGINDITLWAMWEIDYPNPTNKNSLGIMQSFDCDTELPNIYDFGTVIDSRDNNTYTVARLMDDQCWMTQNLKITNRYISNSDSDISNGSFTIPVSNRAAFNSVNMPGGWENNLENNAAYYNNDSSGTYYTWYTATAGFGKKTIATPQEVVENSICPKGWRLPTGGIDPNSDFQRLRRYYTDSSQLKSSPANFVYADFVDAWGTLSVKNESGRYWSSTVCDGTSAHYMYLDNSQIGSGAYNSRVNGYSVRCVSRN